MRRTAAAAVGIGLVVLLAGCLPDTPTREGAQVTWLYYVFLGTAAVIFVLVVGLLIWTLLRDRGGPDDDELPPQIHGNLKLETIWWALPSAIVAVLVVLTAVVLAQVDARREPELTVQVQGYQWQWGFTYPESGVEILGTYDAPAELVLPVDRTVAFEITSRDVVHSFSIPDFLIKRDAVPTRTNRFEVLIEEAGTYSGQCGEFCGLLHSYQRFTVRAVPPDEFDAWLSEQQARADGDH